MTSSGGRLKIERRPGRYGRLWRSLSQTTAGVMRLIYRVVGESSVWVWSEDGGALEVAPGQGRLMGAYSADIADGAWGDLPMPFLTNPRVRFWFTERGWRDYGLRVAAAARASGRPYRVLQRKNPPRSAVAYRDDWQVALLPDRK